MKVDAQCHKGTMFSTAQRSFLSVNKIKIIVFTAFTDCNIFNYANLT